MTTLRITVTPVEYTGSTGGFTMVIPCTEYYSETHEVKNKAELDAIFSELKTRFSHVDAWINERVLRGRKFNGFNKYMAENDRALFIHKQQEAA